MPFLSKVLEKIVLKQLMHYMTDNNLHEVMQSAYKPAHSTETALLQIQNDILRDLGQKKGVILVLLDLSAAFDTIDHTILLARLKDLLGVHDVALSPMVWLLDPETPHNHVEFYYISWEQHIWANQIKIWFFSRVRFRSSTVYIYTISSCDFSHVLDSSIICMLDDTQIYLSFKAQDQTSSVTKTWQKLKTAFYR